MFLARAEGLRFVSVFYLLLILTSETSLKTPAVETSIRLAMGSHVSSAVFDQCKMETSCRAWLQYRFTDKNRLSTSAPKVQRRD